MRIWLAIAAIWVAASTANAREVVRDCSAEADANGVRGQARSHFIAKCKAETRAETRATKVYGDVGGGRRQTTYCAPPINNVADVLIGACIPCLAIASILPNDGHCYGP
jgi:hypothetical protein